MTSEDIEAERVSALSERDRLQAELGEVLMNGGDKAKGTALTKSLQKAQAKLEEIDYAAAAISRAQEAAARAAAEREEREAQEALERRLRAARDDLDHIRNLAGNVDRALSDLAQAMDEFSGARRDYVAKHKGLNIHPSIQNTFIRPNWCGQVLQLLKTDGARDMRRYLALKNVLVDGAPGKSIADKEVPDIARVLSGRDRAARFSPSPA